MNEIYNVYQFENTHDSYDTSVLENIEEKKYRFESEIVKKLFYNAVVCGFKHKVFSVSDEKGLVHYSFVIGKCSKFPFLKKNDYVIGPCWTRDDKRGKGIYAAMINYIGFSYMKDCPESHIYILVREQNAASIRGVEKANFKKVGTVTKSKYLKKYTDISIC